MHFFLQAFYIDINKVFIELFKCSVHGKFFNIGTIQLTIYCGDRFTFLYKYSKIQKKADTYSVIILTNTYMHCYTCTLTHT